MKAHSIVLLPFGFLLCFLVFGIPSPVFVATNPLGAKKQLDSGDAYLDVRTVKEFNEVHVVTEKIANIPYMFDCPNGWVKNDRFLEEVSAVFKKEDHIIVGFHHVLLLHGRIEAWLEKGLPVVRPTE